MLFSAQVPRESQGSCFDETGITAHELEEPSTQIGVSRVLENVFIASGAKKNREQNQQSWRESKSHVMRLEFMRFIN